MRVALFGGTGFIGSYLIDALVSAEMRPIILVRPGSEQRVRQPHACILRSGDVFDHEAVARTVDGADAAIYNIGVLREFPARGITFERLHFDAAKQVMDAARAAGVRRFLLMSANGVKADGTAYQRTKYLAEQYLATTGLDWTVLRPSVLFGDPRGHQEFATQLRRDIVDSPFPAPLFYPGLLPTAAGTFRMSPVHVADVAQAFVAVLRRPETIGQVLTLGGPGALSWRQIIATIAAATGKRKWMLPVPASAVALAAVALERSPAFPITRDQIRMLLEGNTCSPDALRALEIEPQPFDVAGLAYLTAAPNGI
ncbi:MAG: NAD(P)H-binding protein [Thiotrichales bacterium]